MGLCHTWWWDLCYVHGYTVLQRSPAGGQYMLEDGEEDWIPPLMPPPVVKFEL
jgi:hypothetical protein